MARERKLTQAFRGRATQTAADVSVVTVINTGIPNDVSFGDNIGYLIKRVEFELDNTTVSAWANADIGLIVELRSGTVVNSLLRRDSARIVTEWKFAITAQASSVNVMVPTVWIWDAPPNMVIADKLMSVRLSSSATGQANILTFVVYAERTVLTLAQVLRLRA